MSTRTELLDKISMNGLQYPQATLSARRARISIKQVGEACWGVATFALFLLLGPFSAIATLFGLASLARQQQGAGPESL